MIYCTIAVKWCAVMLQNVYPLGPGVTDVYGEIPLDVARRNGHTEVVDYLVSLPQSSSQPGE